VGEVLRGWTADGVPVYLVRADAYFDRDYLYGTPDGDYPDNAERFVFFSRAILELARQLRPRVLHVNDWQTALAIVFLKAQPALYPELAEMKTVITVHNLGYQGKFTTAVWHLLNLDWRLFRPQYLEFYGNINFLKGGLVFADAITTVSPTYAEEIKTAEQGFGLEGVFNERAHRLSGILNGVDYRIWNPHSDEFIACQYHAGDVEGKEQCKGDLQRYFGIEEERTTPVIGMVTRLSAQKGIDLIRDAFPALLRRRCQFVLLGSGDREVQEAVAGLAQGRGGRVGVEIGFSEGLAHRIMAGADILLMPSRYEPGGLTQLYGFKYGTIPVVRATGGLKDTVSPFSAGRGTGNGFVFSAFERQGLLRAVDRALSAYRRPEAWARLVQNAMAADYSWERSARGYLDVYRKALASQ
jgi:starch synthase